MPSTNGSIRSSKAAAWAVALDEDPIGAKRVERNRLLYMARTIGIENHLSHLVITRAERDRLVHELTLAFGQKMGQANQNYTVSSASVLKEYLIRDYKCDDDPW
jgi:hypothetical protein